MFTNPQHIHDDYPSDAADTLNCSIVITVGEDQDTATDAWQYDRTKTPMITSVSPERGGTGGGTNLTIVGTGFRYFHTLKIIKSLLEAVL